MTAHKRSARVTMALALSAAFSCTTAHAELSAGIGGEYFHWKESTSPVVKETGMRLALGLTWVSSREPGWSIGYDLKWYDGSVDYEGATFFGNQPLSGTTDYRGVSNEARLYYRFSHRPYWFMGAFGWDHWRRRLTSFQREDWDVFYLRTGAEYNTATKRGVMASAGVKFPVSTRENAHLGDLGFTENPRLRPGRGPSFYATVGYRFSPKWDVIGYYDSFWFRESHVENAGGGVGVFQPKSHMNVIGAKIQYNFYD